ncbi:hypothetical protein FPQ18DRAFT_312026 [Pyronema domesticum]|nr:hypothetical protein FPQ18DRAFT_312026 [Pyronema domesticum]
MKSAPPDDSFSQYPPQSKTQMSILTSTDLKGSLELLSRGKVRDLYAIPNSDSLLFVATDRISAYDVNMKNGIQDKGRLLTGLSEFWFDLLKDVCPNHLLSTEIPEAAAEFKDQLVGRSMVVKKHKIFAVEAIVRGYITGSAWSEYQKKGTVHGIKVAEGLQESEKFPEPLFTPSTKAEAGEKDENIHPDEVAAIVGGQHYADRIKELAIELYTKAAQHAEKKGIIIADTKFEFGLNEKGEVVLVDEVLTPDSSRFWLQSTYKVGGGQDSYDKQFLRNWLTETGVKGVEGIEMPAEIVQKTRAKYIEAYEMLTGKQWQ